MKLLTRSELAQIVSKKNHSELSDSYIAALIAIKGTHRQKIDRDMKARIMQDPQLIETKRMQILLNRQLKQQIQ